MCVHPPPLRSCPQSGTTNSPRVRNKSEAAAVKWWEDLVGSGGEGIVVKPLQPISRGRKGPVQLGVKVRGPEYPRIIYGPEYTAPENIERLRDRSIGRKRSLAAREFALGVEALERLVREEPEGFEKPELVPRPGSLLTSAPLF